MAYTKQTWADGAAGGTPLSAARLTHVEDGVFAAAGVADAAETPTAAQTKATAAQAAAIAAAATDATTKSAAAQTAAIAAAATDATTKSAAAQAAAIAAAATDATTKSSAAQAAAITAAATDATTKANAAIATAATDATGKANAAVTAAVAAAAAAGDAKYALQTALNSALARVSSLEAALPMPLLSRNIPAFESGGFYPGSRANDGNFLPWRCGFTCSTGTPGWLAYDISAITRPALVRSVLAWYNTSGDYDSPNPAAGLPRDYTIEGNTAAGGAGAAPTTGWTVLLTITGNTFHAREHEVDLSPYNWVRLRCTAATGTPSNDDLLLSAMDIHNASVGRNDDWFFLGDSVLSEALSHRNLDSTAWTGGPLQVLINTARPDHYPLIIPGGHGNANAAYGNANKEMLLAPFTGKYVAITYGLNESLGGAALSGTVVNNFVTNMLSIIDYVISLGKVPVVPLVVSSTGASGVTSSNAALLNAAIQGRIYNERPLVKRGPDLWTFFQAHPELCRDGIHMTYDSTNPAGKYQGLVGVEWFARLWRDAIVANVYS